MASYGAGCSECFLYHKKVMHIKRIIILCVILMLFLSPLTPVFAEEESEESIDLIDTFYVGTTKENNILHVPFSRSWFRADARVYSHDLAKLSLGLATSAFRPNKKLAKENQPTDYNLRSFLSQAGFTDLRSDDYDKDPSMYTVSTVIGHQTIPDGDDTFELIAVGICGQGYMDEWESNLSVGTGKNPEGFNSAAHLVYDRVFGYISENHLNGKMKIWLSGFSRAAAVSNITASLLSDSNTFSEETVFAYTFATPMTVRDREPKLYRNIFNICGKMDPVPNIPFADWGYSRYGITYFTPTMETDSDFWEKREKADKVYEDITGISYWANPDMNSQMRVLMDCLLNICPDVETYHENLQDELISLWAKHDFMSIMARLLKFADNPILVTDENRLDANTMINQIAYLLMDYASSENAFRRFNQKASVGSNFLQTHTPELYVSWIFSVDDPAELYSDSYEYTLLYISGDVTVTISRDHEVLEYLEYGDRNVSSYHYLGVREEKISVLIPRDCDYSISIYSHRDQTVSVLEAGFQVGRHAPKETLTYTSDMKTGEVMEFGYLASGEVLAPQESSMTSMQYQAEKTLASTNLLYQVYSYQDSFTWRDLVLILLVAGILVVATVIFLITLLSMWIRHHYKRSRGYIPQNVHFRPLPIICFFLIQQVFLIKEFYTALYAPSAAGINGFKLVIGVLILIIAIYGYRRRKNRFHQLIIYSVLVLTAADIMMTTSVIAGGLLYIAAYILLCVNFAMEDKPGIIRILLWAALSAAIIYFMRGTWNDSGYLWILEILYILAGVALVTTAFTHSARVSYGSFLLFVAGILIVLNTARGNSFLFHFIAAVLHYIAVCTLASAGSGFRLPKIVPEYTPEPEKEAG